MNIFGVQIRDAYKRCSYHSPFYSVIDLTFVEHYWQIYEAKYVFEAKNIQKMELLVLSTLNWRLQAVTPFSFVDYFLRKFDQTPSYLIMSRCIDLILVTVKG